MSALFEELDHQVTPMGELSLRRRRILSLDLDVFEVKLGDEFLMSSLFTAGEQALARLGLAATGGTDLDVVVGGLGLGHTAAAALDDPRVARLTVVEALAPVIGWHRAGLVPLGPRLAGDPRCELRLGDFFAFARGDGPRCDAILLDIDHSPRALLNDGHRGFYTPDGLSAVARRLTPGGVFAMWSDEAPDPDFQGLLDAAFPYVEAQVVTFENPLQDRTAACTIYVARSGG